MKIVGIFYAICAVGLLVVTLPLMFWGPLGRTIGFFTLLGGVGLGFFARWALRKGGADSDRNFEETVRELGKKGQFSLEDAMRATGAERQAAQDRMRQLVSKGVFEMDVGAGGELLFKPTPFDEARAVLAAPKER